MMMIAAASVPRSLDLGRAARHGAVALFAAAVVFAALFEPHERALSVVLFPGAGINDEHRRIAEALLSHRMGEPVALHVAESEAAALESACGSAHDAWLLPTLSYLFAEDELGARAALQAQLTPDAEPLTLSFRNRLERHTRDKLARALVDLARDSAPFREATGIIAFTGANRALYDQKRRALRAAGLEVPDVVEGGRLLYHELRKPPLDLVP